MYLYNLERFIQILKNPYENRGGGADQKVRGGGGAEAGGRDELGGGRCV